MSTQFEAIAAAVKTRLQAGTPVCPSIVRSRARPVSEQTTQAVVIFLRESTPERAAIKGAPTQWVTRVEVECYAGASATAGDSAVDALLLAVHDRLLTDLTLGGVADDVWVDGLAWEVENQAAGFGCATLTLAVQHETRNNTLA